MELKNEMWWINDAVLEFGRSEDWLGQRLQSIHNRRKAGRGADMQAMQCNAMCDDGEEQLSVQVGMHLTGQVQVVEMGLCMMYDV